MIVEDDKTIAQALQFYLQKWNFSVCLTTNFKNVIEDFVQFQPSLVILDLNLPFFNGFYWCSEIRKLSKIPLIFISSATDNMNSVMAMNMGADDFINKPFDLNMFVSKVNALLRRTYEFSSQTDLIKVKNITLNQLNFTLIYNNKQIFLTKNEFMILQILMSNHERIVKREEIMEHLWDSESFIDDNTLTVNINRLRTKLESEEITDFIHTTKGIGYSI